MKNKNTILTVVAVIIFVAAGYILYRAFFSGGGSSTISSLTTEVAPADAILSQGPLLDLGAIQKYNSQGQLFNYPTVNTSEVSTPLANLIK